MGTVIQLWHVQSRLLRERVKVRAFSVAVVGKQRDDFMKAFDHLQVLIFL